MKLFNANLIAITLLLCSGNVHAIILTSFDFNDTTIADVSPTTVEAGLSVSDFSSPALGFATTTSTLFTSEGFGLQDGTDDNIAGAFAANQFFTFTIAAADPTTTFSLDAFNFDITRVANGANDFSIRSSVDNFATDIVFANQAILNGTTSAQSIDLTAPEFDNLTSIELRIVLDDRQSNSLNSSGTFIDNVELLGSVQSVPEPSSALLLALSGLTLAARRKR